VLGSIHVAADPNRGRPVLLAQSRAELFDGVVRLVGASVPARPVPAGSPFTISLGWSAEGHTTVRYSVFVHLVGDSGKPLAQSDGNPGGDGPPTTDWNPGDYVLDERQIILPRTLPAGDYRLVAGLYEADSGRRAAVVGSSTDGQTVDLGRITIGPPQP